MKIEMRVIAQNSELLLLVINMLNTLYLHWRAPSTYLKRLNK